jgi:AcrR family transcriptional regulator
VSTARTGTRSNRARRTEQRREEILDAALDLFAERGYHNTGVADIAARLRMSHGTFYRYFESKRDILDHVVARLARRIGDAISADNAPGTATTLNEYREQVARIASSLLAVVDDDPRIARVLLLEATGIDPELTARILDLIDGMRALTAEYLAHGVQAGFLRADLDVTETARALNGIVFAGALRAIRAADNGEHEFVAAALRLVFDGIGP